MSETKGAYRVNTEYIDKIRTHRVVELATEALRVLTGMPPYAEHYITDEDARIGRLLMDAIRLLENGPNALDDD